MSLKSTSGSKDFGLRSASLSVMSEIKNFTVSHLDLETFLSAKVKLRQEGFLDSNVKTGLDFAIQTLENFPASKRRDVSLTLEGERQLVRFTSGNPVLLYAVRLGQKGPEFHQKVPVGSHLVPSCLSESHFAGHCCRDELESCMDQARRVLSAEIQANPSSQSELELRIVCGELRMTYATQQPRRSLFVHPHHRVHFGKALNLEKLLETKTRLERSGEMTDGLQACFQHLLINYGQFQEENIRVVLQSDGQLMELVCGRHDYHSTQHFLFTDAQNQAHSHRVQDMEITNGNHDQITTIETKCWFKLQRMTAEALLERKCWMEREKSKSDELIGCLNYLIEKSHHAQRSEKQLQVHLTRK